MEVSPNLWAGVGLVRGGAGTALVGSHTEVADRIETLDVSDVARIEFRNAAAPTRDDDNRPVLRRNDSNNSGDRPTLRLILWGIGFVINVGIFFLPMIRGWLPV